MQKTTNEPKIELSEDRRAFLKTAGKVAITAPAVALLLSVDAKNASAAVGSGPTDSAPNGL